MKHDGQVDHYKPALAVRKREKIDTEIQEIAVFAPKKKVFSA